ncbi:putative mRNA splicing protein [Podospora appendiculata]|uniref:mRNA splicing protein n=1 Tax=Podospora appendiculata TaxID=314037 RepID=A0AAE0XFK1_9PEZI|nr:putative mRNA splicing protein [Podospora appendiculata]
MQGFNMGRYVPPEHEGVVSGNALVKKHPLGSRASKLASQGLLTVRFEMPFAVWCAHCPRPTLIGQGVRFNAEKRRVGSYHTTPVYAFTMRHAACGGALEIRTDPQHTAYVVASGGTKRDTGNDDDSLVRGGDEGYAIQTQKERADARESAFGKLEKTIADRQRLDAARDRIGELHDAAGRRWDDPYARNQLLRKTFRVGRAERERESAGTEALRDRMSLGIELLPANAEDARRAELVDFGAAAAEQEGGSDAVVQRALARPLFEGGALAERGVAGKRKAADGAGREKKSASATPTKGVGKPIKAEIAAAKMRESLVSEIVGNTRAAMDPFLDFGAKEKSSTPFRLPGLKRRRVVEEEPLSASPPAILQEEEEQGGGKASEPVGAGISNSLVGYSSDSD